MPLPTSKISGGPRRKYTPKSRWKRMKAHVLKLCQCIECAPIQNYDPIKGIFNGVYLTQYQHEAHSALERRRQNVSNQLGGSTDEPDTPEPQRVPTSAEDWIDDDSWCGISGGSLESIEEEDMSSPVSTTQNLSEELAKIKTGLEATPASSFTEALERSSLVYKRQPESLDSSIVDMSDNRLFELDISAASNFACQQYEDWLRSIQAYLSYQSRRDMSHSDHARFTILSRQITTEICGMGAVRRDHWMRRRSVFEAEQHRRVDTAHYVDATLKGLEPVTAVTYLLTLMIHFFGSLSHTLTNLNLNGISLILSIAFRRVQDSELHKIPDSLPKDVRTMLSRVDLDPRFKTYVCCPDCFKTFYIDPDNPSLFPEFCDYQQTPNSQHCGSRLRDHSTTSEMPSPARVFLYHDFIHWIGRLYARSDLEDILDAYPLSTKIEEGMKDIWDGSVLRDFCGPDGKPFLQRPDHESRLVFGLNMDGFNPYGNRQAGKKVSIGGVYLVCFNLPPSIRYRMENVFLAGVVPGPQEPSTHQVNHILRPIVDDFLILWENGVYLSKTSRYSNGRPIRAALIPLICDLPAARRAVGLGSHSSTHFCSECYQTTKDINDLNMSSWTARDYESHIRHAKVWRDAATVDAQARTFKDHGIKWSELLRLPYWDPTRFVVMDSMHGFYLRMFMRHVRDVWGMQINIQDGDGMPLGDSPELSEETLVEIQRIFRYEPVAKLENLKKAQLRHLCRDAGLHYGGQKKWLLKLLVQFRIEQGWFTSDGSLLFGPSPLSPNTQSPHQMPQETQQDTTSQASTASNSSLVPQAPSGSPIPLVPQPVLTTPPTPLLAEFSAPEPIQAQSSLPITQIQDSLKLFVDLLPPTAFTMQNEDMALFFHASKSAIDASRKEVLSRICQMTQPPTDKTDYERVNKPVLANIIHQRRLAAGITSQNHKVLQKRSGARSRVKLPANQVPTDIAVPILSTEDQAKLDTLYFSGSKSAFSRARKALLVALCAVRFAEISHSYHDFNEMNRDTLLELLHEQRLAEGIIDDEGDLIATDRKQDTAVLGANTLSQIRADMQDIQLPHWFAPAPKHPGEVKWGKFKADEWKSFCLVNLPITLTRLWASYPKESRQFQMLENYMDLVNAIKIATRRSITHSMIAEYEMFIRRYLEGFLRLYPHKNLTPYQHLSLHFGAHLRRFGPTHSWRCYAFERMNGLIQDLPSNSRFGELEKAKFLRFCRVQNLRAMIAGDKLPEEAGPLLQLYLNHCSGEKQEEQAERPDMRCGRASRLLDGVEYQFLKKFIVAQDSRATHLSRQITVYAKYYRDGARYECSNGIHSAVIFHSHQRIDLPGIITSMFSFSYTTSSPSSHRKTQMFAIVKPYLHLLAADRPKDLFKDFQLAGGFLCQDRLGSSEIIPLSNILTHFARTPLQNRDIPYKIIHVLPLFK